MILGIILIYFVGKAFYDLAARNNKSKWGFAVLGVLSYYVGLLVGGVVVGVVYEIVAPGAIQDVNDIVISIMAFPVAVLSCWGFYKILQSPWSKSETFAVSDDVLDGGMLNNNSESNNGIGLNS